jgi:hypothetical protein
MHLRPTCLGAILAGACVALVAPPRTAAESPAPAVPDLSGRWRLDPALSVGEPAAAAPSTEAAAARKTEKADKPDPPGVSGAAAASREGAGQPVAELVVTQTEVEVTVEEKPGTTLHFYPNGRTYKADEGQSDIRSQWRDGKLVFEKKSQQGWKLTQTWQVAPDRSRLTAELHVEGRGRPKANIKRVYQRVETTP